MKVVLVFLALVAAAYCASIEEDLEKRFFFDTFGLDVQGLAHKLHDVIGSGASKGACEAACPGVLSAIPGGALLSSMCGPACDYVLGYLG